MSGKQQRALVTGASSGIGAEVAVALAQRGWMVYAAARRDSRLRELAERVPGSITPLQLDVCDPESRRRAVAFIAAEADPLRLLINNAGITFVGAVEATDEAIVRDVFETNFFGPLALTRALLPTLRRSSQGRIVNVSAIGAVRDTPFLGAYGASKAAFDAISMSMDLELRAHGVRVTAVLPGPFQTAILECAATTTEAGVYADATAAYLAGLEGRLASSPDLTPVTEAILEAATHPEPAPRYVIGGDAVTALLAPIVSELERLHLADAPVAR
jgi:NAD(P)-dependent dehydrogenase (short-subunit alcohol dehydrogenase family)